MTKICTAVAVLALLSAVNGQNTKHVFWYKCIANNYDLADASGPNIQGTVVKHEGKALTATVRGSAGNQDPTITLGNGLDDAQARSFVFWYKDLCGKILLNGGKLITAKFRGEYRDNWMGNAFCNAGTINARVGVVSIQGHLDALKVTPENHPDDAVWSDPFNTLNSVIMGLTAPGESFAAEEIKNITCFAGNNGQGLKPLEGLFFEMDVTNQVRYILSNPKVSGTANIAQLGIAAVVTAGNGSTGKINLYGFENCIMTGATSDPWTTDGNTCHLILEVENGTIAVEQTKVSNGTVISKAASISLSPSPCNIMTKITYSTGLAEKGVLSIYDIGGRLVKSRSVSGTGSFDFSTVDLTKGLYVCKITAGNSISVKNLIIL
ncbi:MAG: T9SS type A sorting domain-containing protein [Fibrobacteres bacterium]|nr:T9SS type A sorting domain-containing protein [Fibrobacterota bacterium]